MLIRPIEEADHAALWSMLEGVIRAGETYAVPTDLPAAEAVRWWTGGKEAVLLAEVNGQVVGSYYLRTNQPGNGSHVANAGYIVADAARGKGVATAL